MGVLPNTCVSLFACQFSCVQATSQNSSAITTYNSGSSQRMYALVLSGTTQALRIHPMATITFKKISRMQIQSSQIQPKYTYGAKLRQPTCEKYLWPQTTAVTWISPMTSHSLVFRIEWLPLELLSLELKYLFFCN